MNGALLLLVFSILFTTEADAAPPSQAWIFDGSYAASSLYAVAYTGDGVQTELDVSVLFPFCAESPPVAEAGVAPLTPAHRGVFDAFAPVVSIDAALLPRGQPRTKPFTVSDLDNDCDVLEHFDEVESYIAELSSQADDLQTAALKCVADVESLWCELIAAIESKAVIPAPPDDPHGCLIVGELDIGAGSDPVTPPCFTCESALQVLPIVVDRMGYLGGQCESGRAVLNALLDYVLAAFLLRDDERECFLQTTHDWLAVAQEAVEDVQDERLHVDQLGQSCTAEVVSDSCESCPQGTFQFPGVRAVSVDSQRRPILRLVPVLVVEALRSSDRGRRMRLLDLARRLLSVPRERVLHVTAPSGSSISQDFIAFRRRDTADDRRSPQVVIVTTRARDARLAAMTLADERLLADVLEEFGATLSSPVPRGRGLDRD